MKVDSKGQPIADGTFGLYNGNMSARVKRTYIDPLKDNQEVQEIIGNGGYMLDLGEGGEIVTSPDDFTATYDGVNVPANDGQQIRKGDVILLERGYAPGDEEGQKKHYRVRHLYPIGTFQGEWCCEIEHLDGRDINGDGPTSKWGIGWGQIAKLIERGSAKPSKKVTEASTTTGEAIEGCPAGTIYPGDLVKVGYTAYNCAKGVWRVSERGYIPDYGVLLIPHDEIAKASCAAYHKSSGKQKFPEGMLYSKSWIKELVARGVTADDEDDSDVYCDPDDDINLRKPIDLSLLEIDDVITFADDPSDDGESTDVLGGIVCEKLKKNAYKSVAVRLDAKSAKTKEVPTNTRWIVTSKTVWTALRDGVSIIDNDFGNENNNQTEDEGTLEMAPTKQNSVGKVDVVREGSKILLPVGMPTKTAIKELQRQLEQDEMDVAIMEIIPGFPLDAAHAFVKALEVKYGWVNAMPTPGFFGPQPPVMVGVQIDPDGRTVQIPWGQIGIPGITGNLSTGIQFVDGKPHFCIQGTVKQKDKGTVNDIALLTKEYLVNNSIYKGKAIRMKFPEAGSKTFSPLDHQPKFIVTTDVRPDELIFSKSVHKQISVNIWTPIQNLAAVKAARVPLKRGVLLFGRYGVGKTLLASVTARMAVQAGVTFIDLVDSNQLPQAVEFGRTLGGMVVIFAEDIDRCDENGTRTDAFNNILNTVDGLTSKTDEVMIVYTTNHIEKISKAMLRQGRIDKVIHIKEPDADAAVRLVRLYARHMLPAGEDLTHIGELLGDGSFIPAAIREVVEQSKLAAIERGDVHNISAEDLRVTVEATREHMELLKEPVKDDRSDLEKAADAFGRRVASTLTEALGDNDYEDVEGVIGDALALPGKRKAA